MAASLARNAWYAGSISDFLRADPAAILGTLTAASQYTIETTQASAWQSEIEILKEALNGLEGTLFLEFTVPRLGSRVDAIVLVGPAIFALEFKVGSERASSSGITQVWDYALDLKNFHRGSHAAPIFPILVSTLAPPSTPTVSQPHPDKVFRPMHCNSAELPDLLRRCVFIVSGTPIDPEAWAVARYEPTPTIIEAAQRLYANHSVADISRSDAGAKNLVLTSNRIEEIVEEASREGHKALIFVTGVPGAGKTLVGLNVATQRRDPTHPTHAVFLSGNGPLVDVLRESLARDELSREKHSLIRGDKTRARNKVKAFIQNVHHFRDDCLKDAAPPVDRVVIFDEAQRAWDLAKTADFMARRKGRPGFSQSESEFLVSCMDRHPDWAVVVCLVGGGQEINDGEAGIEAWIDALEGNFPGWRVYLAPDLYDSEYGAEAAVGRLRHRPNTQFDPSLHLAVSMRSFRAENVSLFVKALLDLDAPKAKQALSELVNRYPIALTRDLSKAKRWIRDCARGSERFGMVASAEAQRLKPHAVDVRAKIDHIHWFLDEPEDTRSSSFLEDAATEYQVQGLELDWTCVMWDADLRLRDSRWAFHTFAGSSWNTIRADTRKRYLINAYRVLLTRARQGMVIFIPEGEPTDHTRKAEYYDGTFEYLHGLGLSLVR